MENVMQVIHKPTGETRLINTVRFNPEIHEPTTAKVVIEDDEIIITNEEISEETDNEEVGNPDDNIIDEYSTMTFQKLKQEAKAKGLVCLPTVKKQEIIALLRGVR